ncbi:MAG: hypothetical protein E3K37_08270 [Candidatus Kuenenia sp.]|nr:hypothetical protein [Candidatus Kuenenia hertensis]
MKSILKTFYIFCTLILLLGCYGKEGLLLNNTKTIVTLDKGEERSDCDTLVFTCIDYRFAFANQEFINKKLGIEGNYDHISIPGSIYNLVDPSTRDIVFSKINKFVNFHLIKRIIIIGHRDCGGYGGSSEFGSEIAEYVYLTTDLKKAKQILIEKYPILEIDLYLETLTKEGVQFEKVK